MKTVIDNETTLIIKNSKFISIIYNINSIEEINNKINDIKNKYKDATHVCFAYIKDNIKKESDDGEPSGTAGIPILQVLEKNNLNNVLCIVVRYFGGIKLGAGGLVRAYTKAVCESLNNHIKELIEGYNITISFDYSLSKKVDYIIKDELLISKYFKDKITYNLNCTKDIINKLKDLNINITINKNIYY